MILGKYMTLHQGMAMLLAAMITRSDLGFTGRKKWDVFQMKWFLTLPLISLLPFLTVMGRTAWLSPASDTERRAQCFQRGITLQVVKEKHCKGKVCSM